MNNSLSIAVHAFASRVFMKFSVDETLLLRYVNLSTSYRRSQNNKTHMGANRHDHARTKWIWE